MHRCCSMRLQVSLAEHSMVPLAEPPYSITTQARSWPCSVAHSKMVEFLVGGFKRLSRLFNWQNVYSEPGP